MKTNHPFFTAVLALLFVAGNPAGAQDRVALLIGNNEYPEDGNFHPLKNCVNDVELLGKTLRAVGFKVSVVKNASQSEMDDALLTFEKTIPEGGTALIYFAGHGIEWQGQNYLMASNAKLKARSRLSGEAMKADIFAAAMVQAGAKTSFLLLDCCRETPASADWATRGQRKYGLAEISIEGDIVIGLAASPGKPALEPNESGGNSPYALALSKWIPAGLKHTDFFDKVRREVHDMTNGQQRTWENGSFLNPFYFAEATESDGEDDESMAALKAEIERLRKEAAKSGTMKRTTPNPLPGTNPGGTGFAASRGFTNSLGMKFVPVPGTKVLFCEHETRVQDYAAYAAANPGVDEEWKDYEYEGHKQGADHPVVNVSWEDAKAFCAWLSKKEGKEYRLPTDHEWSVAVGIGDRENASSSPKDKSMKIEGVYPWGTAFPPPKGAGNYSGSESASAFGEIEVYRDDHAFTATVKSYKANENGLYDLGGNVWEWCEDWYSSFQKNRVLRGGSWYGLAETPLRASFRGYASPTGQNYSNGFRLAVVGDGIASGQSSEDLEKLAVSEFNFKFGSPWVKAETLSAMRAGHLTYEQENEKLEDVDLIFYYFGESGGGGVQSNIDRWLGQFEGQPVKEIKNKDLGNTIVTFLTAHGTFMESSGPFTTTKIARENYTMLAAILSGEKGEVYLKLTGPADSVESMKDAFVTIVESPFREND